MPVTRTGTRQELHRDRIARVYNGEDSDPETQRRARDRIDWIVGSAAGGTVLDIGCSEGIVSVLLAEKGATVTGVDIHPEAIAYAHELAEAMLDDGVARPTFRVDDALDWESPDPAYDTVILGEVIEHLYEPARMVQVACQSVRPGGRLVLTTPWGYFPAPDHHQTFFLSDVLELLAAEFDVDDLDVVDSYIRLRAHRPPDRNGHPGARPDVARLLQLSERAALESQIFLRTSLDRQTERLHQSWKRAEELVESRTDAIEKLRSKIDARHARRQASGERDRPTLSRSTERARRATLKLYDVKPVRRLVTMLVPPEQRHRIGRVLGRTAPRRTRRPARREPRDR